MACKQTAISEPERCFPSAACSNVSYHHQLPMSAATLQGEEGDASRGFGPATHPPGCGRTPPHGHPGEAVAAGQLHWKRQGPLGSAAAEGSLGRGSNISQTGSMCTPSLLRRGPKGGVDTAGSMKMSHCCLRAAPAAVWSPCRQLASRVSCWDCGPPCSCSQDSSTQAQWWC